MNHLFLKFAFAQSIQLVHKWQDGEREPTVQLNGVRFTVTEICGRLRTCQDALPPGLRTKIRWLTQGNETPETYYQGARHLHEFVRELLDDNYEGRQSEPKSAPVGTIAKAPSAPIRRDRQRWATFCSSCVCE